MSVTINGTNGLTFNDNSTQTTAATGFGFKNRLINGNFAVAQRGTSFTSTSSANNDDTYNLDRWYVLSDGNDIVDITQNTAASDTGDKYNIALDVETVNKKFGIAQIIENINCADLQGQSVTLSFKAKVSATTKLDNVKCAIVAWSGTADTVTSDIISAWNAEGTNPTLIANATYENTPANLNVTTSWATYSVTATVDTSSTGNVIVFIWSDVTDTTLGDFLYITNVQLEKGSTATSFDYRPYGTELMLCQRYAWALRGNTQTVCNAFMRTTTVALGTIQFPVTMRATASLTVPNVAGYFNVSAGGSDFASPTLAVSAGGTQITENNAGVTATFASGSSTIGFGAQIQTNNASSYVLFTAEL